MDVDEEDMLKCSEEAPYKRRKLDNGKNAAMLYQRDQEGMM